MEFWEENGKGMLFRSHGVRVGNGQGACEPTGKQKQLFMLKVNKAKNGRCKLVGMEDAKKVILNGRIWSFTVLISRYLCSIMTQPTHRQKC